LCLLVTIPGVGTIALRITMGLTPFNMN
jgi:hypothetical protein